MTEDLQIVMEPTPWHPDAEQLTAFAEQALPRHERERTLAHLAVCGTCRATVFLAQQAAPEAAPQRVPARRPWFSGWNLVWPAVAALRRALCGTPAAPGRPTAVICHTVKGKGIPFAEHDPEWHHKAKLAPSVIASMYQALE